MSQSPPNLRYLPQALGGSETAVPPDDLLPDSYAARLYWMLKPLAAMDPQAAWSLLIYINAIGTAFQKVDDWVRDTVEGPGWSILMDADRCPIEALPWLGQFVGVRIPPGLTEQEQRDWVKSTAGFRRGTVDALIGAVRSTLTGSQTVIFRERDGADYGDARNPEYAYYLTVFTYASQTPDPEATHRALLSQKPAALVLNYRAAQGQDYRLLATNTDTYATMLTKYADYTAVKIDEATT